MFKLEFKTDNAAFEDYKLEEVVSVLRRVSDTVAVFNRKRGVVRDSNGNTIGSFELTED